MEATREMLHDQDFPMHLWAEAISTIVYVQNHTPHRVLDNKTSKEDFLVKTISQPSENIWLSSVHTYPKGENNQA